ncbi:MAG: hypothetical protein AAFY42_13025, partial [Pseudomonadota bacterium]
MKAVSSLFAATLAALALTGCVFGGGNNADTRAVEEIEGGSNPYLWRASLDTLSSMPLVSTIERLPIIDDRTAERIGADER